MSMQPSHPQSRNKLLNHVLDDIARDDPSKIFAEIPKSLSTVTEGFRNVTYREIANAVNGIAAHLEEALGKGDWKETLAYVGLQDLRYVILLLGAVKVGYTMLYFSPRFPPLAAANLFAQTNIKTILTSNPKPAFLSPILKQHPLREVAIPDLDTLLESEYPDYAYDVSFETARNHPFVTVHTSGSTGLPKPIVVTHEWVASLAEELYLEPPEGYRSTITELMGLRLYFQFPFFHMSFIIANIILPLLTGTTVVYAPAGTVPTASTVADVVEETGVSSLCLTPLTLLQISQDAELQTRIAAHVKRIVYAGGDLPLSIGNVLADTFQLTNVMASTEYGIFHGITPISLPQGKKNEHWHALGFHPASNVHFVQREADADIYEAVVRRKDTGHTQTVFRLFPSSQEVATGDLYRKHASVDGLWDYAGRSDDMIIFASGEKFWPLDVERRISQHADVHEALIIGTGRERVVLLLDIPAAKELGRQEAIDRIWPVIEATHDACSPAAQILREFILVADPERPFVRTPKGSVQRGDTARLYAEDIAKLDGEAAERNIAAPPSAVEILTKGV